MTVIDKRKFLAELGRLLTFMFDEDRRTALAMYEEIFDSVEDPEELLKLLVSPTRQAVIIARTYNARERDLAVRSKSGDGDANVDYEDAPRFVRAIDDIAKKAAALYPQQTYRTAWDRRETEVGTERNLIREFPEESAEPEQTAEPEDPVSSVRPDETVTENHLPEERQAEPFAFVDTGFERFINGTFTEQQAEEETPSEQAEDTAEELSEDDPEVDCALTEEAGLGREPEEDHSSRIDRYMASFDEEEPEQTEMKQQEPVHDAPDIKSWRDGKKAVEKAEEKHPSEEEPPEVSILLMILYIILAVPITAVGVLILLVPAILFLAVSLILITVGFQAITTAFGGFAVFADIMVVLGGALVVISLGLLALWTFIWFIGGAIVGLINAVIRLGGKFCTMGGED